MNPWQGHTGYQYGNFNTWNTPIPMPGTTPGVPVQMPVPYHANMPVSQPYVYSQRPGYPGGIVSQPQYTQPMPPVQSSSQYVQQQPTMVYPPRQTHNLTMVPQTNYSARQYGDTASDGYSDVSNDSRSASINYRDRRKSRSISRERWSTSGRQRRLSRSPEWDRRQSRSPDRDQGYSRSPGRDLRWSRSPNRDRRLSRSPDRIRGWSRSPGRNSRLSRSPGRNQRWSRSPGRNSRLSRSPGRSQGWSRSPGRNSRLSRSPGRNQRWSRSPGRNSRLSRSPGRTRPLSRSPDREKQSQTESRHEREMEIRSSESRNEKDQTSSDIFKRLEAYKKKFNAMKTEEKDSIQGQSNEMKSSSGKGSIHKPQSDAKTGSQKQSSTKISEPSTDLDKKTPDVRNSATTRESPRHSRIKTSDSIEHGDQGLSSGKKSGLSRESDQTQSRVKSGGSSRNTDQTQSNVRTGSSSRNNDQTQSNVRTGVSSRNSDQTQSNVRTGGTSRNNDQTQSSVRTGVSSRNSDQTQSGVRTGGSSKNNDQTQSNVRTGVSSRNSDQTQSSVRTGGSSRNSDQTQSIVRTGGSSRNSDQTQSIVRTGGTSRNSDQMQSSAKTNVSRDSNQVLSGVKTADSLKDSDQGQSSVKTNMSRESNQRQSNVKADVSRHSNQVQASVKTSVSSRDSNQIESSINTSGHSGESKKTNVSSKQSNHMHSNVSDSSSDSNKIKSTIHRSSRYSVNNRNPNLKTIVPSTDIPTQRQHTSQTVSSGREMEKERHSGTGKFGQRNQKGDRNAKSSTSQNSTKVLNLPPKCETKPEVQETKEQFIKRKQEEFQKKIIEERERIKLKRKASTCTTSSGPTEQKQMKEASKESNDKGSNNEKETNSGLLLDSDMKKETINVMPKIPLKRNRTESPKKRANTDMGVKNVNDPLNRMEEKDTRGLKRKNSNDNNTKTSCDEKRRKKDKDVTEVHLKSPEIQEEKEESKLNKNVSYNKTQETDIEREEKNSGKQGKTEEVKKGHVAGEREHESEKKRIGSKIDKSEISEVLKMVLDDDEIAETDDDNMLRTEDEKRKIQRTKVKIIICQHPCSVIDKLIESSKDKGAALVGLQYVTEIPKATKRNNFYCRMCRANLFGPAVLPHVTGYKHRIKYFTRNRPHVLHMMINKCKKDCQDIAKVEAEKAEKEFGRQRIVCVEPKTYRSPSKSESERTIPDVNMWPLYAKLQAQDSTENAGSTPAKATGTSNKNAVDISNKVLEDSPNKKPSDKARDLSGDNTVVEAETTSTKDAVTSASLPNMDKKTTEISSMPNMDSKTVEVSSRDMAVTSTEHKTRSALKEKVSKVNMLPDSVIEALGRATQVSYEKGRQYIAFYKFIQNKPDVPLLGLSMIVEVSGFKEGPAVQYVCEMCRTPLLVGAQTIFDHTQGVAHIDTYLKIFHKDKYRKVCDIDQEKLRKLALDNQARLAYLQDGKGKIKVTKIEEQKPVNTGTLGNTARVQGVEVKDSPKPVTQTPTKSRSQPEREGEASGDDNIKVRLFDLLDGLDNVPMVGLNYITEIQTINNKGQPRYECRLCDTTHSVNFINAHLTSHDHRSKFLRTNYPLLYSRTAGTKDLVQKYVKEIENRYGRESVWVKSLQAMGPNGMAIYSEPIVVKGPWQNQSTDKETKGIEKTETGKQGSTPGTPTQSPIKDKGAYPGTEFAKIIEGLDYTPLLGLQYITEVQHPSRWFPAKYECTLCHHVGNGTPLTTDNILNHISARGHRLNFFRDTHEHIYKEILSYKDRQDQNSALTKHTKEIEATMGRGLISHMVSNDLSYWAGMEEADRLPESLEDSSTVLQSQGGTQAGSQVADSQLGDLDQAVSAQMDDELLPQPPDLDEMLVPLEIFPKTSPIVQDIMTKKDGAFSWKVEFEKMQEKIKDGRMIQTDRKSRYSTAYGSSFSGCPTLGIHWILEVQRPNIRTEPYYLCRLCQEKIIFKKIISHISGLRHKISYMGQCYPEMYQFISQKKFTNVASLRVKVGMFAEDISKKENKYQGPVVLMELDTGQIGTQTSVTPVQTGAQTAGTQSQSSWTLTQTSIAQSSQLTPGLVPVSGPALSVPYQGAQSAAAVYPQTSTSQSAVSFNHNLRDMSGRPLVSVHDSASSNFSGTVYVSEVQTGTAHSYQQGLNRTGNQSGFFEGQPLNHSAAGSSVSQSSFHIQTDLQPHWSQNTQKLVSENRGVTSQQTDGKSKKQIPEMNRDKPTTTSVNNTAYSVSKNLEPNKTVGIHAEQQEAHRGKSKPGDNNYILISDEEDFSDPDLVEASPGLELVSDDEDSEYDKPLTEKELKVIEEAYMKKFQEDEDFLPEFYQDEEGNEEISKTVKKHEVEISVSLTPNVFELASNHEEQPRSSGAIPGLTLVTKNLNENENNTSSGKRKSATSSTESGTSEKSPGIPSKSTESNIKHLKDSGSNVPAVLKEIHAKSNRSNYSKEDKVKAKHSATVIAGNNDKLTSVNKETKKSKRKSDSEETVSKAIITQSASTKTVLKNKQSSVQKITDTAQKKFLHDKYVKLDKNRDKKLQQQPVVVLAKLTNLEMKKAMSFSMESMEVVDKKTKCATSTSKDILQKETSEKETNLTSQKAGIGAAKCIDTEETQETECETFDLCMSQFGDDFVTVDEVLGDNESNNETKVVITIEETRETDSNSKNTSHKHVDDKTFGNANKKHTKKNDYPVGSVKQEIIKKSEHKTTTTVKKQPKTKDEGMGNAKQQEIRESENESISLAKKQPKKIDEGMGGAEQTKQEAMKKSEHEGTPVKKQSKTKDEGMDSVKQTKQPENETNAVKQQSKTKDGEIGSTDPIGQQKIKKFGNETTTSVKKPPKTKDEEMSSTKQTKREKMKKSENETVTIVKQRQKKEEEMSSSKSTRQEKMKKSENETVNPVEKVSKKKDEEIAIAKQTQHKEMKSEHESITIVKQSKKSEHESTTIIKQTNKKSEQKMEVHKQTKPEVVKQSRHEPSIERQKQNNTKHKTCLKEKEQVKDFDDFVTIDEIECDAESKIETTSIVISMNEAKQNEDDSKKTSQKAENDLTKMNADKKQKKAKETNGSTQSEKVQKKKSENKTIKTEQKKDNIVHETSQQGRESPLDIEDFVTVDEIQGDVESNEVTNIVVSVGGTNEIESKVSQKCSKKSETTTERVSNESNEVTNIVVSVEGTNEIESKVSQKCSKKSETTTERVSKRQNQDNIKHIKSQTEQEPVNDFEDFVTVDEVEGDSELSNEMIKIVVSVDGKVENESSLNRPGHKDADCNLLKKAVTQDKNKIYKLKVDKDERRPAEKENTKTEDSLNTCTKLHAQKSGLHVSNVNKETEFQKIQMESLSDTCTLEPTEKGITQESLSGRQVVKPFKNSSEKSPCEQTPITQPEAKSFTTTTKKKLTVKEADQKSFAGDTKKVMTVTAKDECDKETDQDTRAEINKNKHVSNKVKSKQVKEDKDQKKLIEESGQETLIKNMGQDSGEEIVASANNDKQIRSQTGQTIVEQSQQADLKKSEEETVTFLEESQLEQMEGGNKHKEGPLRKNTKDIMASREAEKNPLKAVFTIKDSSVELCEPDSSIKDNINDINELCNDSPKGGSQGDDMVDLSDFVCIDDLEDDTQDLKILDDITEDIELTLVDEVLSDNEEFKTVDEVNDDDNKKVHVNDNTEEEQKIKHEEFSSADDVQDDDGQCTFADKEGLEFSIVDETEDDEDDLSTVEVCGDFNEEFTTIDEIQVTSVNKAEVYEAKEESMRSSSSVKDDNRVSSQSSQSAERTRISVSQPAETAIEKPGKQPREAEVAVQKSAKTVSSEITIDIGFKKHDDHSESTMVKAITEVKDDKIVETSGKVEVEIKVQRSSQSKTEEKKAAKSSTVKTAVSTGKKGNESSGKGKEKGSSGGSEKRKIEHSEGIALSKSPKIDHKPVEKKGDAHKSKVTRKTDYKHSTPEGRHRHRSRSPRNFERQRRGFVPNRFRAGSRESRCFDRSRLPHQHSKNKSQEAECEVSIELN